MTAYFTPTATIRNPSGDSGDSGDNVDFIHFFPNAQAVTTAVTAVTRPCRSRSHDAPISCWGRTVTTAAAR